ncbi:hypothetical protein Tsubulata_016794 [Turnera subulata]|uniref:High-affinity nitrate transporter n=1 Tax=Turnera subulata TaxID=218843 RepID=A0A9Q0F9F4_9ROSI|nr:hypothetical protein Tsubulata_016794 [Turnera subulata]
MASLRLLLASLVLSSLLCSTYANVLFSSLKRTLIVTASPPQGAVLKAGVDKITVTWGLNQTLPAGTDSAYKTIKVKLCYAPISQKDRAWRKTEDKLSKDKTCPHKIVAKPYNSANKTVQSFEWLVERDVPTATYFVRAYALDSAEDEVGYGQTTDVHKATSLFQIQAITGRHTTMDICSICFSAFAVVSLFGFFFNEKRRAKKGEK